MDSVLLAFRLYLAIWQELPQDYPRERALVAAFDIVSVTQDPGQMAVMAVSGYQESRYTALRHRSGRVCGVMQVKKRNHADCERMISERRYGYVRGLEMLRLAADYCRKKNWLGWRNTPGRCVVTVYAGGPNYQRFPRTVGYVAQSMPRIARIYASITRRPDSDSRRIPRPNT